MVTLHPQVRHVTLGLLPRNDSDEEYAALSFMDDDGNYVEIELTHDQVRNLTFECHATLAFIEGPPR